MTSSLSSGGYAHGDEESGNLSMSGIVHGLLNVSGPIVYVIVGALAFAEAALFVGFVLPGETAVIIGGVLAQQGKVSLPVIMVVAVVAAIVGDSVGYEIGRRFGTRLLKIRPLRRHQTNIERAQRVLRDRGPIAVFIGRFVAVLRALMPALAGSAEMPYPRFLLWNALGGTVWAVGYTMVGYLAGSAYDRVAGYLGTAAAVVVAVLVVVALTVWAVRRHRRSNREEAAEADRPAEPAADDAEADRRGEPAADHRE
jgi:membrane protein DedA with SNARE-associated domain